MSGDAAFERSVERFFIDYAACLDETRFTDWPAFFVDEGCRYEVLSRENYDRGMPAPLMSCYSHGMLVDRVAMLANGTLTYRRTYQRRFVSNVTAARRHDGSIAATANLLVMQSDLEGVASIYLVGRYDIELVFVAEHLKLRSCRVILDSFGIDNMLAIPL